MSGDSEGTPNPLNPNPGATASTGPNGYANPAMGPASFAQPASQTNPAPRPAPVTAAPVIPPAPAIPAPQTIPAAPARPTSARVVDPMMRRARPLNPAQTTAAPVAAASFESLTEEYIPSEGETYARASEETVYTAPVAESTMAGPSRVAAEPTAETVVTPAKKRHKRWPIVVAFVCFLIAVGCGVAAALMFLVPNNDRVALAMQNLMNNGLPSLIKADGEINLIYNDPDSDVQLLNIDFVAEEDTRNGAGDVTATVTATMKDESDFSFDVDEVNLKDGDIYFKLSDISAPLTSVTTSCAADDTECAAEALDNSSSTALMQSIFEIIDDQWILVDGDFIQNIDSMGLFDNQTVCLLNTAMDFPKYGKDLAKSYEKYPFVTYSTDDIKISQKRDNLYKLGFDLNKMASFVNSLDSTAFMSDLASCVGGNVTREDVTAADLEEIYGDMPLIYTEVDSNNRFTRFYFDADITEANVRADIDLSYPAKIEVTEPEEYITLNQLLSSTFNDFFSANSAESVEVENN